MVYLAEKYGTNKWFFYCGWKKFHAQMGGKNDIVLPRFVHINPCYPLVNVYITMDISTMLNGKINDEKMAMFNSYVKLPEGKLCSCFGIKWHL